MIHQGTCTAPFGEALGLGDVVTPGDGLGPLPHAAVIKPNTTAVAGVNFSRRPIAGHRHGLQMCQSMSMYSAVKLSPERCEAECVHPEHVSPLLDQVLPHPEADRVSGIFGLLADPNRARILHALSLTEELCVCDLALLVGMGQSAVSHQLRLLRTSHVVERRKVGRIVYYRLADAHIRHVLAEGLRHAAKERA